MNDDGHDPQHCNYTRCGYPDNPKPCPFVRDLPRERVRQAFGPVVEPLPVDTGSFPENLKLPAVHRHEWRQYWRGNYAQRPVPDGFYCTKCLERRS